MFLSHVALAVYYLNVVASSFEGDRLWSEFKTNFNKSYTQHDESKRRDIFEENLKTLRFHNAKYLAGLSTFKMGINDLSDKTFNEFKLVHSSDGKRRIQEHLDSSRLNDDIREYSNFKHGEKAPDSFDWRDHINFTKAKNQGNCGACYSFAAVGAFESLIYRQTGEIVDLSEQEIIDCGQGYFIAGCDGGYEVGALNYIIDNGIGLEEEYPYVAKQGPCRRNQTTKRYKSSFEKVLMPAHSTEKSLKRQLLLNPTIIGIDHVHESFMRYGGGIYYESDCEEKNRKTSHIMLLVGYGSEKGEDYWIVKNSFGEQWGEDGYIRIARNKKNHCRIAKEEPITLEF